MIYMFSRKCLELVKVLHEIPIAYKPNPAYDDYDSWDNNVGECPSWFYGICRYEEQGQELPCFGCGWDTHP